MSTPRSLFYANADLAKWHKALIASDNYEAAVTYALAEYAHRTPNSDKMIGVMDFLAVFRDLSTKPEEPTHFVGPRLVPPEELGRPKPDKPSK